MNESLIQLITGSVATAIFVSSNLPMLWKAVRTQDMASYSLAHIGLSNAGNAINWLYVVGLPFGPIWLLHAFNTIVAVTMLVCYWRFERHPRPARLA